MTIRPWHILLLPAISWTYACAQMPVGKVVVVDAQLMDAAASITLVGTVEPARRSRVSSEIAGIVARMQVRQGDRLAEGALICKLNDDTLVHKLAEARAKLDSLRAKHAELQAGTRPEDLTRLKARVDEAAAQAERWTFEMDRINDLYEGRDANHKEIYDTRAELLGAQRRKIAAQASYDLGVKGPRVEVIAQAAYDVAAQQAVAARIETDLHKTSIVAPFAGYVSQRVAELGEWIPAGGQVVELIDLSTVLVRVDAPEAVLPYLVLGDTVRVKVDALGRSFVGKIKHIIPQAHVTARTFPVEVEIDNSQGVLAGGMFARATVTSGPKSKVVVVPKDAVVERDGVVYVAIIMPGKDGNMVGIRRAVTLGADVGDWITITSKNVAVGTKVIIRGNEDILPFPTPVQVVDEKGTPVAMPPADEGVANREGV